MDVTKSNIKDFIYTPNKYFQIPDFQRPYCWNEQNINEFLDDLESAVNVKTNHYFGTIVFVPENNNVWTLIDGQQRATTVLLFMTAIYHLVKADSSKSAIPHDAINESFLFNKHDYTGESNRIKLRTVVNDNAHFEAIYEEAYENTANAACKFSHLFKAYKQFLNFLKEKKSVDQYIDALERFQIVTLSLNNMDDNPQRIFESINSTGQPLNVGDKIRNFVLMTARQNEIDIAKEWREIEQALTSDNTNYLSEFFMVYLIAELQRPVKADKLYPEFKQYFVNEIDGLEKNELTKKYFQKLSVYLKAYKLLKLNDENYPPFKFLQNIAWNVNYLKIETVFPFLMRVLVEFDNKTLTADEVTEIFKCVENFLARRIICSLPSTGLNKLFPVLYKQVKDKMESETDTFLEIMKHLLLIKTGSQLYPRNAQVKDSIATIEIYSKKQNYAMFILASVESRSKESGVLLLLSETKNQITIEHIMPRTLNQDWKRDLGIDADNIHQRYLNTLANLTLTGYNQELSNRSFTAKRDMKGGYKDSQFKINKYIAALNKFDGDSLQARVTWWYDEICSTWPEFKSNYTPQVGESDDIISIDDSLVGKEIVKLGYMGEWYETKNWITALELVLKLSLEMDDNLAMTLCADNLFKEYVSVTPNADKTKRLQLIDGTELYLKRNSNNNEKVKLFKKLLDLLDLDQSDLQFEVRPTNSSQKDDVLS